MTAPDQEPIDLVDALNTGRINRRDFMRRGVLLGLSIPTITALLASCGGDDDDDDAEGDRRHRNGRRDALRHDVAVGHDSSALGRWRHDSHRPAEAGGHARSDRDAGSRGIRHDRLFLRVPGNARRGGRRSRPDWRSRGSPTPTARSGRSNCAKGSSGTMAPTSRRPTWPRRSTGSPPPGTPGSRA